MAAPDKIRVVYILSASHSGSTLLSMLLGSHPEICTVGEIKATSLGDPEQYLCSCRNKIKKCRFWADISLDMVKRGLHFDITNAGTDIKSGATPYVLRLLRPLHRGTLLEGIRDLALNLSPTWRMQLQKIQKINATLMECILARTGKKILVDSSKIGIRLKYLLRNPLMDVQIIRLIRDGRAVALTYTDPAHFADAIDPLSRGGGMGGNREMEKLSIEQAAWEWRRGNEEAEAILNGVSESRKIEVHYETLCAQRDKILSQLFRFIGVKDKETISDYRVTEHHIIGNGMRLDLNNEIICDERWKTLLSASALETFESVAGKMNRRLGYR